MKKLNILLVILILLSSTVMAKTNFNQETIEKAEGYKELIIKKNPHLKNEFKKAYGYVIIEHAGKGAYFLGFGGGNGVVYEQGEQIGFAKMRQATIGAAIGGQGFGQVIFFENKEALERFKTSRMEMSAQVSATAANAGVGLAAPYIDGVKLFTDVKGGLMAEASFGGQKLKFIENS